MEYLRSLCNDAIANLIEDVLVDGMVRLACLLSFRYVRILAIIVERVVCLINWTEWIRRVF